MRTSVRSNEKWPSRLLVNLGSRGGDALVAQGDREVLRRFKGKAGVNDSVNLHNLWHGLAREFLKAVGTWPRWLDIMGQSDVRVTWTSYAVFPVDGLKAAHTRYSPVAQLEREGAFSSRDQ